MTDPKPITLTQVDAEDYESAYVPQPFLVVGPVPSTTDVDADISAYFEAISGYDDGETQTLKSVSGVLTWVTDEA